MHSIKKIGVRLLVIVVVVMIFEAGVRFAYEPYTATVRYTQRDRNQTKGTIDTLYCGTSTMQRGIDVNVADKMLSTNSFNTASSLQPLDGTYFLLKDMVKDNPVKTVFLGISPDAMVKKKIDIKWKSLTYDRLNGVEDKMAYLLCGVPVDEWPYLTLYSVRTDNYFDFRAVKENVKEKLTGDPQQKIMEDSFYKGRGGVSRDKSFHKKEVLQIQKGNSTFLPENMNEKYLEYFRKCLDYCKERDINVIILYPPMTGDRIERYGDITPIHDYFAQIAKEYDAPFWDFNYHTELKTLFQNDNFEDAKHLNEDGSRVFTKELATIYQKYLEGEDVSVFFSKECPYYTVQ